MGNMVKIDGKPVGLFGLELALQQVKKMITEDNLTADQGAKKLLELLKKKNYIPSSKEKAYLKAFEALLNEKKASKEETKTIRILGPGCVGCNKLETIVLEVLSERQIPADIFHVTDKDEIFRYGVTKTPALIINDKLVSAGPIPSKAQIEKWLLES